MNSSNSIDTSFLGHPKPLYSIAMTELWERFSFYGIRPLLVLFMSATLISGGLGLSKEEAAAVAGIFGGCIYLAALPGGWLADNYLGQKKAILFGCFIIALGHLSIGLSYFSASLFFLGLALIVIGTGLFKTCSSVIVGMLYKENDPRRDSGFTIFYMGINIGAFFAPLVCGFLQVSYGWHFGFAAGGIGMLIALCIFTFKAQKDLIEFDKKVGIQENWDKPVRDNKNAFYVVVIGCLGIAGFIFLVFTGFININPLSLAKNMLNIILSCSGIYFIYLFFFSSLNQEDKKKLFIFVILFFAAAIFWSVYEQQYTSFNFFADKLTDKTFFNIEIPTVWFQSLGGGFVIVFAPLFSMLWIFLATRNYELSSLTKFAIGLILASIAFILMALASSHVIELNGGETTVMNMIETHQASLASPWWLILSFLFLVLGELCLSPVGLSLMTKIAPNLIKSQVMGLWFVSLSLGNVIAGLIGGQVSEENILDLPALFYTCVLILLVVAMILFILKYFTNKFIKQY